MPIFTSFYLVCKAEDPKPLKLELGSDIYYILRGKAAKAELVEEREFLDEDLIELERRLSLLKLSYNDLIHGSYYIKARRFLIPHEGEGVLELMLVKWGVPRPLGEVYVLRWLGEEYELMIKVPLSNSRRLRRLPVFLKDRLGLRSFELRESWHSLKGESFKFK